MTGSLHTDIAHESGKTESRQGFQLAEGGGTGGIQFTDELLLVEVGVVQMAVHAVDGSLQEVFVEAGVVHFLSLKDELLLKVLHHSLACGQQVSNAGMQHTQAEGFANETVCTSLVSLYTVFFLLLGRKQHDGNMAGLEVALNASA